MWRSLFGRQNTRVSNENLIKAVDFPANRKEVGEYTSTLWRSVSISRAQFDDHYVQTIRNVATYMQDPDRLSSALKAASEAVRGTMLLKLPYNRSREEGGKHEQLWKYIMFSCHMVSGAGDVQRRFYNAEGKRVLIPNLSTESGTLYDDGGSNSRYLVFHNISSLLPDCSIDWILRDQERGMVEISRAAFGLECFIDNTGSAASGGSVESPEKAKTAVLADTDNPTTKKPTKSRSKGATSNNSEGPVAEDSGATGTPIKTDKPVTVAVPESTASVGSDSDSGTPSGDHAVGMTEITGVPSLKSFRKWVRTQTLPVDGESGHRYLECPEAIEQFLKEKKCDCPASIYQAKLASHGYPTVEIEASTTLVILITEKLNV